jgi:hypothetical protein
MYACRDVVGSKSEKVIMTVNPIDQRVQPSSVYGSVKWVNDILDKKQQPENASCCEDYAGEHLAMPQMNKTKVVMEEPVACCGRAAKGFDRDPTPRS